MALNVGNATSSTGTGTSLTIQFPSNITAGSTLVVGLVFPDDRTATLVSLTDNNSNKWKNAGSAWDFQGQNKYVEFWVAENSIATPNVKPTVTLTVTASVALILTCCEVTGAATQYSLDQATYSQVTAGGIGVPFSSAPTPTTYQANEAVIGFGLAHGTLVAGSGFTSLATGVFANVSFVLESQVVSVTGQYSSTFSNSSSPGEASIACVMTIRAPGAITSFYHVQGNMTQDQSGGGLTTKLTLAQNPTQGNLVCLGMMWFGGGSPSTTTITSIIDDNGNHYTVSPASIAANVVFTAYFLSAPANASKGITVTFANGVSDADIWGDEFTYPGICTFDTDTNPTSVPGGLTGSGNNLNTVSITPAGAGELLWCQVSYNLGPLTAPHNGSALNGWTGGPEFIFTGQSTGLFPPGGAAWAEYYLSAPAGPTSISYTDATVNDNYNAAVMAFKFTVPPSAGAGGATGDMLNITRYCSRMWP